MKKQIVVVGASFPGLMAVEQLRTHGWTDAITIIGAEPQMPGDREETPKQLQSTEVSAPDWLSRNPVPMPPKSKYFEQIEWQLANPAVSCSIQNRSLVLADGRYIRWDGLVIASELRPRKLPLQGHDQKRFVVRTLEDAVRLRSALTFGCKVTIVGAAFLGCEIAAVAKKLGCTVTVIDANTVPLERVLGTAVGRVLQKYLEAQGINFALGLRVDGFSTSISGELDGLQLSDGTFLATDIVVEALGSQGNLQWLEGNGLDLHDGVLCDEKLRVTGVRNVVAVDDVARFVNPLFRAITRRPEHWASPEGTAHRAALSLIEALLGQKFTCNSFQPLPYHWASLFSLQIQLIGAPELGQKINILEGKLDITIKNDSSLAIAYLHQEALTGILLINLPHKYLRYRGLLINSLLEKQETLENA